MNLRNKKNLATNALKVGRERIVFLKERIEEIKDAITKQDIRDLKAEGAIIVKDVSGRRKNVKRKNAKGPGNIKKKVSKRKQEYVIMTRKLRAYVREMKKQGKLTLEEVKEIRKKIRNKDFKSKANLKLYIGGLRK
jgi:large subunit ribosomal protein L19e